MSAVPADRGGPSLRARVAIAVAMTVGFYVLALGLAVAMIGLPIAALVTDSPFSIWLPVFMLGAGFTILRAITPRRRRFEAPGVRLTAAEQPRLMAAIDSVARDIGEPPPDEVYATLEVNAAVTEPAGLLGRRRRRVLIVGLPLVEVLTVAELRSVIAHEFGHYVGGDTRYGPWTYRTREAIERTIHDLRSHRSPDRRLAGLPFLWYGRGFLRVTNAISRRQEFAADALAARIAGRDAHAETLRKIHAYAPAFDAYWGDEVLPVLNAGLRPPIASGFAHFRGVEVVARAMEQHLGQQMAKTKSDPYDSHPTLSERLAFVEDLPPGESSSPEPALDLIAEPASLEQELLVFLAGPERAAELRPVDWADTGDAVFPTMYRELATVRPWILDGASVHSLPERVHDIEQIGARIEQEEGLEPGEGPPIAAATLGGAYVVALTELGWHVSTAPGEGVTLVRGEERLEPFAEMAELRQESVDDEGWRSRMRERGIEDVSLGEVAPNAAAGPVAERATLGG